jgi:hypothetical protein
VAAARPGHVRERGHGSRHLSAAGGLRAGRRGACDRLGFSCGMATQRRQRPTRRRGGRRLCSLLVRGVLGLARRTDLVSPGLSSPRFRALDRKVYSPLCLTIAALAAPVAQPGRGGGCGRKAALRQQHARSGVGPALAEHRALNTVTGGASISRTGADETRGAVMKVFVAGPRAFSAERWSCTSWREATRWSG